MFHLASLHSDSYYYWVSRIENVLREDFHLAGKYCYVPESKKKAKYLKLKIIKQKENIMNVKNVLSAKAVEKSLCSHSLKATSRMEPGPRG